MLFKTPSEKLLNERELFSKFFRVHLLKSISLELMVPSFDDRCSMASEYVV